jgi:hypothetical protein
MNKTTYTVEIDRNDRNDRTVTDKADKETFGNWKIYRNEKFFARGHFADSGCETIIDEGNSIGWMGEDTLIYLLVEGSL